MSAITLRGQLYKIISDVLKRKKITHRKGASHKDLVMHIYIRSRRVDIEFWPDKLIVGNNYLTKGLRCDYHPYEVKELYMADPDFIDQLWATLRVKP